MIIMKTSPFGLVALLLICIVAVGGAFTLSKSFGGQGKIVVFNVEVYSDAACTSVLTSVNWNELVPGDTAEVTIYIKNLGNKAATLSMTTTNWNPTAAGTYLSLAWDREAYVLVKGEVIAAVLTLSVSPSTTGIDTFTFTTIINAHS